VKEECRILNLSFGLDPHEGFLSVHAAELDALSREFGVLFVVSSGNVNLHLNHPDQRPRSYPQYLLDKGCRVLSPAEALNVLTIGGITPDQDLFNPQPSRQVVAPKRSPAPFGCSGGIKNVIKPELVEVAGNLAYDTLTKTWVDNEPGLRVVTTNPRFATGALLGFVHGTSFSAPRVAHLASRLIERYPDASPNLLRALLVQSARPPEGVREWAKITAMRLCGFGLPNLDRALYCGPQRATLFHQGDIAPDEVKLFDIPVPEDFAKAKGRKTITITLAFDPPVSVVHRDRPAGVHLTWRFARGDKPVARLESAIASEVEEEVEIPASPQTEESNAKERTKLKSPFMRGELPIRIQQGGTVQKNIFAWTRGVYGDTYRLAVTARAVRPAHAETRQSFSVVVSLECEDAGINVFQLVRTRLAAGRVRVRVPSK
jgi:hypothetical protein